MPVGVADNVLVVAKQVIDPDEDTLAVTTLVFVGTTVV